MILFQNVSLRLGMPAPRQILSDVTLELPTDRRIALFAPDAVSNSAILGAISTGVATRGWIERRAQVSFLPRIALASMHRDICLRMNTVHAARLYGSTMKEIGGIVSFVSDFMDLGDAFERPLGQLSIGMQMSFATVLALSIPFDMYLFEGAAARGDPSFRGKIGDLLEARAKSAGILLGTQDLNYASRYCDCAAVLNAGKLILYDNMADALSEYGSVIANGQQKKAELSADAQGLETDS